MNKKEYTVTGIDKKRKNPYWNVYMYVSYNE